MTETPTSNAMGLVTDLTGQIALVTGASSGIGRGVAIAFGASGARVVINYPDATQEENANAVCAQIIASGGQAMTALADVAVEQEVDAMMQHIQASYGDISILVNNAGIAHSAPLEDIPVEAWDRLIAVHLRGAFLCTRRVLPSMYKARFGRVITTASQLAYKGAPGFTHYTAAKGALISMTRSLALEAGARDVTFNCVAPGATRTPILDDVPADILEQISASIPLGRIAEVDDIVPTYVMLASSAGRHYQGQCLSPNGGDAFL